VSADGRFVAFVTGATNFDPAHTNLWSHVYVHDFVTGQTVWASPKPDGTAGFGANSPSISADGRFVVLTSSDALVLGDTGYVDVFVRDLQQSSTSRASVSYTGGQADGPSSYGRISGDGRYVAFISQATTIVPNDTNGLQDIFVRDTVAGISELVHLSSTGIQGNAIAEVPIALSYDGRFVMFASQASNLVTGDTNGKDDVFIRDRLLATTIRVSIDSAGNQGNDDSFAGDISDDGRFVVFASQATNLVVGDTNGFADLFVHDRQTGVTTRVSVGAGGIQANDVTFDGRVSGDGRYVTFATAADNLSSQPNIQGGDVFVHDRLNAMTRLITLNTTGAYADAFSSNPDISADGQVIVYESRANNLVPYPPNNWNDVFAVRQTQLSPATYCTGAINSQGCVPTMSWTGTPSISAGSGFDIQATGLVSQRNGLLLYSKHGPTTIPMTGGTLCVAAPLRHTAVISSRGLTPCDGTFAYDFNLHISSGIDPGLGVGQPVWAQYWSRDPDSALNGQLNLTDALFFLIEP
jgi:Tol biopolymer transport system component